MLVVSVIKCVQCGASYPQGSRYCPGCGVNLTSPSYSPPAVWPPPTPGRCVQALGSFFMPVIGFVAGLYILLFRQETEWREAAHRMLRWSVISCVFLLLLILAYALLTAIEEYRQHQENTAPAYSAEW